MNDQISNNSELRQFRVIGPPGAGKTSFLSRQCTKASDAFGASRIAVCSLTRTSAARVTEKLAQDGVPIPEDNVGTLHSFAFRALGVKRDQVAEAKVADFNDFAAKSGARLFLKNTKGVAGDDVVRSAQDQSTGDAALEYANILRARMVPFEQWPPRTREFYETWQAWKREAGLIDFTDMLEMALRDVDACPGNPDAIFFDESQDLSALGWALARKWGEKCVRFVTAGDPWQLLYGWAGSDVESFYYPKLPEAQERVLSQSWRVPQAVHAQAVAWIGRTPGRVPEQYLPTSDIGEVKRQAGYWKNPEKLLPSILRLIDAGKTVAVVTTASYMLLPFMAVLRDRGIPYANPYAPERTEFNPLTRANGVSWAQRLADYLTPGFDERADVWTLSQLHRWTEHLDAKAAMVHGGKAMLTQWLDDAAAIDQGKQLTSKITGDPASILCDSRLLSILPRESWEAAMTGDIEWLRQATLASKRKGLNFPGAVARRAIALKLNPVKVLREVPRLILSTIHAIKGGECDVCYLFPDLSPAAMQQWDKPDGTPGKEEIRRGMYVGMTRCRDALHLCEAASPLAVRWN